ncbi:hypothetical protein MASR2M48_17810 [Spirochaetota bacterium]
MKWGSIVVRKLEKGPSIDIVSSLQPRLAASLTLSSIDPGDEKREGSAMHVRFSAPMALAAMTATMAESMPPTNLDGLFQNRTCACIH